MGAIDNFLVNGGHPTPPLPEPSIVPRVIVVAPIGEKKTWMQMIERFQKLRASEFHGGSNSLVADRWKGDMENILDLMGIDPRVRSCQPSV